MAILNTNDGTASAGALAEAGALSNASAAQQTGTTKKVSSKQASKAKTKGTTAGEPVRSSISGREAEEIRRASNAKAELILKKLRTAKGASLETLKADTGWQAHWRVPVRCSEEKDGFGTDERGRQGRGPSLPHRQCRESLSDVDADRSNIGTGGRLTGRSPPRATRRTVEANLRVPATEGRPI
jgi:hypothetical protein